MRGELYIRVKQALAWLKRNQGILQKDVADKMGMAEASFTRALSRIKEKNDEDFVVSFHSAVGEFISLDYLLTGNGTMLATKSESQSIQIEDEPNPQQSSSYIDKLIASLENQIKAKEDQLADKDRIIKLLEQKIEVLEAMQHIDSSNPLKDYPFTPGVADKEEHYTSHV